MKKWLVLMVVIAALTVVGLMQESNGNPVKNTGVYRVKRIDLRRAAFGQGRVESVIEPAQLTFETIGRLKRMHVAEGQLVTQGELLAELDPERMELELAQAEIAMAEAQARLAQLKQGPYPEDLQQLEARLQRAKLDTQSAELRLSVLQKPEQYPVEPWQIQEAQLKAEIAAQELNAAVFQQDKLRFSPPEHELAILLAEIDLRENDQEDAQKKLKLLDDKHGTRIPDHDRSAMEHDIERKKRAVKLAQRRYESAKIGPTKFDKDTAIANAQKAKAGLELNKLYLERLQNPPAPPVTLPSQITLARFAVEMAKAVEQELNAALERAKQGPREADLQVALAGVKRAEKALSQIQAQRKLFELRAPFDGLVARRYCEPGVTLAPFAPVVQLVDVKNLRVRSEINVDWLNDIKPGQAATFSKKHLLPDAGIAGSVQRIASQVGAKTLFSDDPTESKGGEVALVLLSLDQPRPTAEGGVPIPQNVLRPGLRVEVRIDFEARQNVLAIPLSYLEYRDGKHTVHRAKSYDPKSTVTPEAEPVEVQLGFRDLLNIEVISGLQEGDYIVRPLRYQ